jgi:hypothetical protein
MLISEPFCALVSPFDICLRLADIHENSNYLIKSIALPQERNADRCIQATGIGQYNFRHRDSPFPYRSADRFNPISWAITL